MLVCVLWFGICIYIFRDICIISSMFLLFIVKVLLFVVCMWYFVYYIIGIYIYGMVLLVVWVLLYLLYMLFIKLLV